MEPRRSLLGLPLWLALCFAPAWFGARFRPGAWYASLAKPWWTPPDWLFAPVWTILYIMMAVAAWLIWRERGFGGAATALGLFVGQLALNGLWSWVFFGLQRPGLAFAEITLLWAALAATATAFGRLKPAASLLLLPYFLWVSFALVLNFALWRLNG